MTWFHAVRARLQLLAPRAAETRIDDEIRFHIEMETQRLMREQKLDQDEARRRALVSFGGVQQHRETLREGRGTAWFSGLSLDLKLGVRMLIKYPGLTLIGGLAMAFGIWFGAVTFEMFGILTTTKLPLPGGDRIVKIKNWDTKLTHHEDRVLYDYQLWRTARSITDIGAYRDVGVNLVGADGTGQPAVAAEITPSAFRIAPERPLLGRVLTDADAQAGAAPVVVLGYELWNERFARDSRIVGRTVQLGSSFSTVVGVMPESYAFPMAHELWLPLRTDIAGVEPRSGFEITVFGRLANGMTREKAQSEMTSLGRQLAAERPATHAQLQPHVLPYTQESVNNTNDMPQMTALIYFFIVVLMVVVCSTVALLLFARAAARETEILVRSALGASRRRIVTQLFAEALVLAGVAAVVGLAVAQLTLTNLGEPYLEMNYGRLPFWYEFNLSPKSILYALLLAVIGAVVAGVMPARKITRGLGAQLRAGTAGGGGESFGGVWTAVIVVQVALTVAFPAAVMLVRSESKRVAAFDFGFPAQQYLAVKLGFDGPTGQTPTAVTDTAASVRFSSSLEALRARLEGEPGVAGVTFVDVLPGEGHDYQFMEVESMPGKEGRWVATASIDHSYFPELKAPMAAGRAFTSADLSSGANVAIVDERFVELVMPGRNPVGHRVRLSDGPTPDSSVAREPWHEIVGVVKGLGMGHAVERDTPAGVYLPSIPGTKGELAMMVHGRGDPVALAPRVRELATTVDPAIRVEEIQRVDEILNPLLWFLGLWLKIVIGLTGVALLLSLAGIYAVLSYTVARRTREIGVRVALGASARRVVTSIFKRPLTQVTMGVIAGSIIIAAATIVLQNTQQFAGMQGRGMTVGQVGLLIGYSAFMLAVCMVACVVPTLRVLRVQPTEALRAE